MRLLASAILARRPDLKLVKVADGAADNWTSSDALPSGEEAVDFFHAGEHLHAAIATVYGDGTHETQFRYATLRDTLRDEDGGVDKIIRALKHLASKHRARHPSRPSSRTSASTGSACATWSSSRRDS